MGKRVEFRSVKFPPYEGEEEEVNPGRWGKRLAEYLSQRLTAEGIETEEIYSEDWGWAVPVRNDKFSLWVSCGNADETDGFLCFIEPSKPEIRKLFKKIDTTQDVARVTEALERIFSSDSEIRDVRWSVEP